MKTKKAIATFFLYNIVLIAAASDLYDGNSIVRKKNITKAFDVRPDETLSIDNSYGDVKIQLWDKPSIRIDITITASGTSDVRVNESIGSVNIEEKRAGNRIPIRTAIAARGSGSDWGNKKGGNSLRIDYQVHMPKQNPLQLKNAFGNTDIARFLAPLTVETRYGNFRAEDLASIANDIIVLYGNAVVGQMGTGKLESKYSQVKLDEVEALELVNKFGSIHIGKVGSLKADIGYSGAKIGTLTDNGVVKLSYSNGFSINESTAELIDIQAAYSSVTIPVQQPARFDVSVSYGNFQYPGKTATSFTNKSENSKTKQYQGTIGSENPASTIRVISKYGNVKLKD